MKRPPASAILSSHLAACGEELGGKRPVTTRYTHPSMNPSLGVDSIGQSEFLRIPIFFTNLPHLGVSRTCRYLPFDTGMNAWHGKRQGKAGMPFNPPRRNGKKAKVATTTKIHNQKEKKSRNLFSLWPFHVSPVAREMLHGRSSRSTSTQHQQGVERCCSNPIRPRDAVSHVYYLRLVEAYSSHAIPSLVVY